MDDLDLLARHRPTTEPPSAEARGRARAAMSAAIAADRRPSRRRPVTRLVPAGLAAAVVVAVVAVVVLGVGTPGPSDDRDARPVGGILAPAPAAAVVEAVSGPGYTDVHFLEPSADPERIASELAALGLDLEVTFPPADPFSVGRLVYSSGTDGIELLDATGSELEGGALGIRVPDDWSGSGEIAIARAAGPGERFETSLPLNAERPGGPLHCTDVRGRPAPEAAEVVRDLGLQVEWRTLVDDVSAAEPPPADFVVHDVQWSAPETILLFAAAGPDEPLSADVAAMVSEGCDGTVR